MKTQQRLRQNRHDAGIVGIIVIVTLSIIGLFWLVWSGGF